jgi:hypothetical protein
MERLRYSVKLRSDRRETMVQRSFEDLSLCYTGVCMAEIENIWIGFRLEAKATSHKGSKRECFSASFVACLSEPL